jgi:carbonic anhydrase
MGITKLKDGLHQFLHTVHASERDLFERLAGGQDPSVLFVTCSDSRISPSLITQTKPGDLFVLRNVANIVPPYTADLDGEAAVVEYAISVLKVSDVIVCGHTQCGGMEAVLDPEKVADLPAVKEWLRHADLTRRLIANHFAELDGPQRVRQAVEVNVMAQLANLRTHPAVAIALKGNALELHGWVYDIAHGTVSAFDTETDTFIPITGEQPAA